MSIQPTNGVSAGNLEYGNKITSAVAASVPARPSAAPAEAVTKVQQPGAIPDMAELQHAVEQIKRFIEPQSQGLEFSIDDDSQRTVVKIIDTQTKEVLRQIPSEEALRISKSLDQASGLLIRQQA